MLVEGRPVLRGAVMSTALFDAAFRLVSHSLAVQDGGTRAPRTADDRLAALRAEFPDADPAAVADAYVRAQLLEAVALALGDADRGSGGSSREPMLSQEVLAERCPGFSVETYWWAVYDGFVLIRK
jgi:hypothetical protein